MKPRRFRVGRIPDAETVRIEGDEAHHARSVLRLTPGDEICVFDGQGREALGRIDAVAAGHLTVRITQRLPLAERKGVRLFLATAIPKGERADWMMEKCAEFGVEAIIPLRCARATVVPGQGKIERWRRKAGEAAKQSGQASVMRVEAVREIHGAIGDAATRGPILFGDPRGEAPSLPAAFEAMKSPSAAANAVTIFVGPEGGFTQKEIAEIESRGGRGIRLAGSVLRIETAALAAAAIWAAFDGNTM